MAKKVKLTLLDKWGKLPKEVKVIPYILVSGALTALVDYLTELKLDDKFLMATINLVIIFLVQAKPRFERMRK